MSDTQPPDKVDLEDVGFKTTLRSLTYLVS